MTIRIIIFGLLLACLLWGIESVSADCNAEGPENCTFHTNVDPTKNASEVTWSSWNKVGGWLNGFSRTAAPWYKFPGLYWSDARGQITSRVSCSTQGNKFCFVFDFTFSGESDKLELNVYIKNVESNQPNTKIWSSNKGSFKGDFETARVDVQTTYDFSIVIEAVQKPHAEAPQYNPNVNIDDVHFVKKPCPQSYELPLNCSFEKDIGNNVTEFTPCSWTNDGGWNTFWQGAAVGSIGLGFNQSFGHLVSSTQRTTYGHEHSLMFEYSFSKNGSVILFVKINNDFNKSESVIWSESSGPYYPTWKHAKVPVLTTFNFVIVFQASRLSNETVDKQITAYVDNIAYITQSCTPLLPNSTTTTEGCATGKSPTDDNITIIAIVVPNSVVVVVIVANIFVCIYCRHRMNRAPAAREPL
jgi:hypothetical protein